MTDSSYQFKPLMTSADEERKRRRNRLRGDAERPRLCVFRSHRHIYAQLIDLRSGESLAEDGDFNGQISYGEDVISRIVFAEKAGGLERLHQVVTETMNTIIGKIVHRAKVDPDDIAAITLSGNTTMTQLLLQVNPRYIRRAPYVPASTLYPPIRAINIGLDFGDHVSALVYPAVSSYVGGDIVAGVMGSGMYLDERLTLFMDIGTNAEIVIGNKDWLACAACSAGPAFEGGGIKFGMRAAKGAIEDFSLDPVTWEPMLMTIGNKRPKGICGSGMIDLAAQLFLAGMIDIDKEKLMASILQYNGFCEKGHDDQFAKNPKFLHPVKTPEFYAIRACPTLVGTVGGIKINSKTEVLNKNDEAKRLPNSCPPLED